MQPRADTLQGPGFYPTWYRAELALTIARSWIGLGQDTQHLGECSMAVSPCDYCCPKAVPEMGLQVPLL